MSILKSLLSLSPIAQLAKPALKAVESVAKPVTDGIGKVAHKAAEAAPSVLSGLSLPI